MQHHYILLEFYILCISYQENHHQYKQKSVDDLKTGKKEKASSSQKSASKKMKELGNKMKMDMDAAAGDQLEEDVEVLRQVLDNLLAFSLSQEDLLKQFKSLRSGSPNFNKLIKINYPKDKIEYFFK